jgi:hypothetical protein
MAANLADHPFLAQLKALKEAFDRVQVRVVVCFKPISILNIIA